MEVLSAVLPTELVTLIAEFNCEHRPGMQVVLCQLAECYELEWREHMIRKFEPRYTGDCASCGCVLTDQSEIVFVDPFVHAVLQYCGEWCQDAHLEERYRIIQWGDFEEEEFEEEEE